jgi:hypothetical protein
MITTYPKAVSYVNGGAGVLVVKLTRSDGVTPVGYVPVTLTAPLGVIFDACMTSVCVVDMQGNGSAGANVIGQAAGTYLLQATYQGLVVSTTIQVLARSRTLTVVSAPSGSLQVGAVAAVPFSVQLLDPYGNPMGGQTVNIGGVQGAVVSTPCGFGNCQVTTDGNGIATTSVTPIAPGAIMLTATWLELNVSSSFTAVGGVVTLNVVTAPPANVTVGTTVPFSVQMLAADGVTPLPNRVVWVLVSNGTFAIKGCASGQCKYGTDAKGMVSLTGIGWIPGKVTLVASTQNGDGLMQQVSFMVSAKRSLTAMEPQTYVAAGARAGLELDASAVQSSAAAAGLAIAWTGKSGFAVGAGSSTTNAAGDTSMQAMLGPLGSGSQTTASACAWTTVCAMFTATGVTDSAWQIEIASGGQQAAAGGAALNPVAALVTDGAGHQLLGATVTVGQTVRALDGTCPVEGRCPAAPVLASSTGVYVSDASGTVSVTPLVVAGTATTTAIAFSAGTNGFATAVVSSQP